MRTLFVGDVHGCATELGRLLDLAEPTDVVLVGDLFLKGPDPVGVWRLIRERGLRSVLGNHDVKLLKAVVKRLGTRASLALFEDVDHSFHVPARSGRKDADARCEMLDAVAAWTRAIL